jgi:tRNA(fMet)-specific endonuclease VapC
MSASGDVLLDTNVIIAVLAGEADVIRELAGCRDVRIPSIALGELYFGAWKSAKVEANMAVIERFASSVRIVGCDSETAREYGRIKNALRIAGRPIPENDLWIASQAIQHGLVLISRDEHFANVPGLQVEKW